MANKTPNFISMIKVRVIQAMIQVARPTARGVGRVRELAMELKCIEIYRLGDRLLVLRENGVHK